jgi:hypothetical protein
MARISIGIRIGFDIRIPYTAGIACVSDPDSLIAKLWQNDLY